MTEDTRDHASRGRRLADTTSELPVPESVARWLTSGKRLLLAFGAVVTLSGGVSSGLTWIGGAVVGPNAKIEIVDSQRREDHDSIAANKRFIGRVHDEVSAVGSLVAS